MKKLLTARVDESLIKQQEDEIKVYQEKLGDSNLKITRSDVIKKKLSTPLVDLL